MLRKGVASSLSFFPGVGSLSQYLVGTQGVNFRPGREALSLRSDSCPAECGHQREQLDPPLSLGEGAHYTLLGSRGGGCLGVARMSPTPQGSLLPPPPPASHPVPTLVTSSSHSEWDGVGNLGRGLAESGQGSSSPLWPLPSHGAIQSLP